MIAPDDLEPLWPDADPDLPRRHREAIERRPLRVADVIEQWRKDGPLVHEPTEFDELDKLTGGGPVYGTRWYLLGAPDAGKTLVLVQLAHTFARRGVVVGYHAVDEEAGDVVTRLAQRSGYQRRDCEQRDPLLLDTFAERIGVDDVLHIYDGSWTIEGAMNDLAQRAGERHAAYFGDSIQTLECDLERGADDVRPKSLREAVSARVAAMRAGATRHRAIAIAASEMNRAAYRTVNAADEVNDLASAKESGAIEYSGRVLLVLRNVPADVAENVIECRIAKNKHGPSGVVYFAIDRAHMALTETDAPDVPSPDEKAAARLDAKLERNAPVLVRLVLETPGIGNSALLAKAKAAKLGGREAIAALVQHALAAGLIVDRPKQRGEVTDHHYFVPSSADEAPTEAA